MGFKINKLTIKKFTLRISELVRGQFVFWGFYNRHFDNICKVWYLF